MSAPSASPKSADASAPRPWWRYGMVWMILGGPAVVVVAGLFTYYLAARSPDPVLSTSPAAGTAGGNISEAPAMTGRNHAATGELPAKAIQAAPSEAAASETR